MTDSKRDQLDEAAEDGDEERSRLDGLNIRRIVISVAVTMVVLAATGGMSALLFAAGGPVLVIVAALSLVAGVVTLPAAIYILQDGIPGSGLLSRVLHMVGALTRQRTVLVQVGSEFREVAADPLRDPESGEVTAWRFDAVGRRWEVSNGLENLIRFGKKPLALFAPPIEETWRRWARTEQAARVDGGGIQADLEEWVRRFGNAAGPGISADAEAEAKAEYGGSSGLGTKWMVVGVVLMALIGGGLGYVMVM